LDTSLAGQEITRAIVVMLVAVGTLERADIWIGHERVGALAGNALTPLHGEPLTTGFAFDQPDQRHLAANLPVAEATHLPTQARNCKGVKASALEDDSSKIVR
jgi:hypothetical protein